ncbi:hypothetical protein SAMN06265349_101725 [Flavobacterium resistens]|uniref:Uncharacterized protein n=1 Tax=Flavobacterium resistens TaxID=443612 RepID=A0A521B668_9FLAO|nr:hypothetical protein [Flavobacterium resistens]MRX70273.1 hypothetical protein [Flavobacterium resistens]SMO42565.1 hypothetical protein SAMN06265349_101725 [Flavobacterium resistens]
MSDKKKNQVNASIISDAFAEKVENYFAENPKKKKVYVSSDGYLFEVKKFATNHGDTLEDKEIITAKNPLQIDVTIEEEEEEEDPTPPSGVAATQKITQ